MSVDHQGVADSPVFQTPRAAYIHVPFCAHRCGYCDFTLVAGRDDLISQYLRALETDLRTLGQPPEVDTLFLGGGTPTHLPAADLERLLDLVRRWFRLSNDAEFSVEANPSGLSREKIAVLADRGVNRVSLGVQSFDPETLARLERDHGEREIRTAVENVHEWIANLSIDLIFGVPGQTRPLWIETLGKAVALRPAHVSTYGLTFEKGTTFWSRREKGSLVQLPDEIERDMYAAAMDELETAGIEQYEISNFARQGFACRHNGVYWAGLPYYGFGPGAARYIRGRREQSHRSTTTWIRRILAGQSPIGSFEELDPEARARETLVLGLRRTRGVNRALFRRQTGFSIDQLAPDALARHVRHGLIDDEGTALRLTRAGRFVADSVIVDLL